MFLLLTGTKNFLVPVFNRTWTIVDLDRPTKIVSIPWVSPDDDEEGTGDSAQAAAPVLADEADVNDAPRANAAVAARPDRHPL